VPALDALAGAGHSLVAVFTKPDSPAGRGRALQASPVKQRALELALELHQPISFKTAEACRTLAALKLDALVVVAYGLILPPDALAAPRLGCFNIHASLLPRWRGAAPIQRAILAGDARTGVTIMRMQAGLDTGPMLAVRECPIGSDDNAATLHDRLAMLGAELIRESIDEIAAGRAVEVAQPASGVTYARKIDKTEALIDWRQEAEPILRQIRAFNPAPVAETRLHGTQLRIWAAAPAPDTPADAADAAAVPGTVLRADPNGVDVASGHGVVRVLRMQLAGRKILEARDFIKSQPLTGARFES
jgi:methionyl-tRNA formyltransferase